MEDLFIPTLALTGLLTAIGAPALEAQTNHALGRPVTASSLYDSALYPAENAVDGDLSDGSRWLGAADPSGNQLIIELDGPVVLRQAHLYSGFQEQAVSTVDAFAFEAWDGAVWQPIPGSTVSGEGYFATSFNFDAPVTTDRVRLSIADTDVCRVRELSLWSQPTPLFAATTGDTRPLWVQQGFVNHALGKPTIPSSTVAPDEARFAVDGVVSDTSRWTSAVGAGESLEVELGAPATLAEAHVYSAVGAAGPVSGALATFEFTDNSLAPTLTPLATDHGITVSDLTLANIGDVFDGDGSRDFLRISGDDTATAFSGTALSQSRWLTFSLTIPDTVSVDLTALSAELYVANGNNLYSLSRVYSSIDGTDDVTGDTVGQFGLDSKGTWGPGTQVLDLATLGHDNLAALPNGSAGANVQAGDFDGLTDTTVTFYLPWIDDSGSATSYTDLDSLTLTASLTGGSPSPGSSFHLEAWDGGAWVAVPGGSVSGSTEENLALTFDNPVTTERIRVVNDGSGRLQIRELALWGLSLPLNTGMTGPGINDPTSATLPIASLNQIGYQLDAPKRFTAPLAPEGAPFEIVAESDPDTVLFSGTISGGSGDFSAFQPASPGPYVLSYTSGGVLPVSSYPFLIEPDLITDKLALPCIQCMVDIRSGVGTHPSAFGGNPWRDGTYYSFEIPSLIYLHLNAPELSRDITTELDYDADKATALDPGFPATFVNTNQDSGFVTALQSYYTTYDPPLPGCPDALELVHFGLGLTMERPITKDPSGDPLPAQLHSQTREWFAWFLYSWPAIRDHLPDSFYEACRDFTFANWATSSGLDDGITANNQASPLDIDPLWDPSTYRVHNATHPNKGRHPVGHSILPNLLLWQVALREERADADTYLAAAQAQTQWVIDHIDWNHPDTTKGQRMSEHKLIPGLVHFLRHHPAEAPAGLAAKIEEWADIMIARGDNMWDFRRYELADFHNDGLADWTLPKQNFNWNEPGNLGGFPACALAAAWTLDHAPAKQQRLRELSQAAIDCLFGRNPLNTGSSSYPEQGFPDVETTWTPIYTGVAAWPERCRGIISSGPGSEHFPYNPDAAKRHNEGWTHFNAALNMGVAYLLADRAEEPEPLAAPFPLEISEILAQPASDPLAEFIELHNPTAHPVRLSGLVLGGDIDFTVSAGTPDLAAGGRCLVVRDASAFEAVHGTGLPVIGVFSGDLDDEGAPLELGDINGNVFLAVDASTLPRYAGHSSTLGASGWRLSADLGGSPGGSDSIGFAGDPSGDSNGDGIPDLVHHATTGTDRPFTGLVFDLSGPDTVVRISRNLAADDTSLTLEWSTDMSTWHDAGPPASELPGGDRLAEWSFVISGNPESLFVRLVASQ